MVSKVARRYSKALLQSAVEQNILDKVNKDIRFILKTVSDSRELRVFLKSPIIKSEDKLSALSEIFKKHISEQTMVLLRLLTEKKREKILQDICLDFVQLYNEHQGIIQVEVSTAYKLADSQQKDLLQSLEASTGKKVEMELHTDPELKGGIVVKIGDTVIDGSVKHKIRKLKNQFAVGTAV